MDQDQIKKLVETYRDDIFKDIVKARDQKEFYAQFSKQKLRDIDSLDLEKFIVQLWAMGQWGDKHGRVKKFILPKNEGDYSQIGKMLAEFIYGEKPLASRWDDFVVTGFGPAMKSEILFHFNRTEYIVWNTPTRRAFEIIGMPSMPVYNYQVTGEKYEDICRYAKKLLSSMEKILENNISMTEVNEFIWLLSRRKYKIAAGEPLLSHSSVEPSSSPNEDDSPPNEDGSSPNEDGSLPNRDTSWHNEMQDKIVEIGSFLGFDSEIEGNIVSLPNRFYDAIWKFKIGNMGQIAYVFEVQNKGSIDSLIVKLLTAANQPNVQAVVAVSDDKQLEKIGSRFKETDVNHRKLILWNIDDVIHVHEMLESAYSSLNSLGLVPSSNNE